jgi:hypothetical protein
MPVVEGHVDDFLRNKLKNKMPAIGMLICDKTINSLKEIFLREIEELFQLVVKKFADNLKSEVNIEPEVAKKINSISPEEMEKMFAPALLYFNLEGAISGFVIGLINVVVFFIVK